MRRFLRINFKPCRVSSQTRSSTYLGLSLRIFIIIIIRFRSAIFSISGKKFMLLLLVVFGPNPSLFNLWSQKNFPNSPFNESDLIFPLKMYLSLQKVLYFKPLCHSSRDLDTSSKERPSTGSTEHRTGR